MANPLGSARPFEHADEGVGLHRPTVLASVLRIAGDIRERIAKSTAKAASALLAEPALTPPPSWGPAGAGIAGAFAGERRCRGRRGLPAEHRRGRGGQGLEGAVRSERFGLRAVAWRARTGPWRTTCHDD